MKILVPAIGSRGDVQPYIALCQGLLDAGHEVLLATNPTLMGLVESYGIPAAPIGKPVDMGAAGADIYVRSRGNFYLSMIRTMNLGFQLLQDAYPDLLKLVQTTDLVVTTDTNAGSAEADSVGKPWISVTLQPARIPATDPNVSFWTRAFFPLVNGFIMAPINKFRRKVGAPPAKDMGSMLSQRLVLIPVSPAVHTPDPRWPAQVHMTGYWEARSPNAWTPPADLVAFIEGGERPVAISLGAMSLSGELTRQAAQITLEAVRQAGVRAVIQGWDEALQGVDLPPTVYHAGSLPHSWLFPRMKAVVHHGGFGTTAAGLTAGVPSLVIPHIIDQLYWADRVSKLGVGPAYIHRGKLSTARLAAALKQAAGDEAMQARAAALGAAIRAEPSGVQAAVRCIESLPL